MLKISAIYLDKQKSFDPKKKCGMLVIDTLKCKISDFLNSNTFSCCNIKVQLNKNTPPSDKKINQLCNKGKSKGHFRGNYHKLPET